MSVELKIKSKSLAAEARIIRDEELKVKALIRKRAALQKPVSKLESNRRKLYMHRVGTVREEARATFLARAYLSGKTRERVEKRPADGEYKPLGYHVNSRVKAMVTKYGPRPFDEAALEEWLS